MHYKVFMDTNIYDASNYAFQNGLFSQLRSYAQAGELELQINSVVKGEVERHIKKTIKEAANDLRTALTTRHLALFRSLPEYEARMEIVKPGDWVDTALAELEQLLLDCKVENITSNDIDVEKILSDYFELRYPFESSKKEEFPDAITVLAVAKEIERISEGNIFPDYDGNEIADDLMYCIVSGDKGFCTAIETAVGDRPNEDVKLFSSLNELINFFTVQDEKAEELQKKLEEGFANEVIALSIEEGVDPAAYIIDESDGYVEDSYCIEKGDYAYTPYVVGLQTMSDGTTVARLYVEAEYKARLEYEFINETESYWDREDHDYLWKVMTERVADFTARTSLSFTIIIRDGEVEFGDYIDVPSDIDISSEDLIEVISSEDKS